MTPRFDVTTVTGYTITPALARGSGIRPPGVSAHVIDRAFHCKVVATYRSEDTRGGARGAVFGVAGARSAAQDHAAYVEALYG